MNISNANDSSWLGSMMSSFRGQDYRNDRNKGENNIETVHIKRLGMILRYIATMHHSATNNVSPVFVKDCYNANEARSLFSKDFFRVSSGDVVNDGKNNASIIRTRNKNKNSDSDSGDDDDDDYRSDDDNDLNPDNEKNIFLNDLNPDNNEVCSSVLFTTSDFRDILLFNNGRDVGIKAGATTCNGTTQSTNIFHSSLFSFYRASSPSTIVSSGANIMKSSNSKIWLRLTRPAVVEVATLSSTTTTVAGQPPTMQSQAVRMYVENWKAQVNINNINKLLTIENLSKAPRPPIESYSKQQRKEIKTFLLQYKDYLSRRKIKSKIEPMYNNLFEWLQQQQQDCNGKELVWGFGCAKQIVNDQQQQRVVNGPLFEVLVEVELHRDGSLIISPREHTGVSINREVISAIVNNSVCNSIGGGSSGNSSDILSKLHRDVSEMETTQLSPGEPTTYNRILKRMAMELSANGIFKSLASSSSPSLKRTTDIDSNRLVVTDAWCIYVRNKPSTVWARDAKIIEEQLLLLAKNSIASSSCNTLPLQKVPTAAWSLTHGSGAFDMIVQSEQEKRRKERKKNFQNQSGGGSTFSTVKSFLLGIASGHKSSSPYNMTNIVSHQKNFNTDNDKLFFPLPTSASQHRIAELLLTNNYPAVVCEGPPGTGKTHTIANIICAFLSKGKRVLITSKGTPALSVLRQRLPKCVQDLCVDVSTGETKGMRQLQDTVERLADKVSYINTTVQIEKCNLIQQNIDELENELEQIHFKLQQHNAHTHKVIKSPDGQRLTELALSLVEAVPWLMKTTATWKAADVKLFHHQINGLFLEADSPLNLVTNYTSPASDALISLVASEAGSAVSYIKNSAVQAMASLPLVGKEINRRREELYQEVGKIQIDGDVNKSKAGWHLALKSLTHDKAVFMFHQDVMESLVTREKWSLDNIYENDINGRRRIKKSFVDYIGQILQMKLIGEKLKISNIIQMSNECAALDNRRSMISHRIQQLAEELVEAKVVSELSQMFSSEAQSALIRFAQIAGKNKFNKSSQPSKMTQRQKRHRQEYLDAFEKCVRTIPCWILTSSQVSDYLPPELSLFDLVIIDEASQSDATVLPSMLRGKQWLIVGDGKQVSPSENFLSEVQIESLRAALPSDCPVEDCLLPGHSFFDLCAQAYPKGRTVLCEHFRCSPAIIVYSNKNHYGGKLVPLRLPTTSERMTPSIIDVYVPDGVKVGKVNEKECDRIVTLVQEIVALNRTRSIGIISLVGDEQARLIRGRLLDVIGPQKYKEHDILVGDPPNFQGSERDVIFLSLCCSPGRVPTQNQLMHAQRANVALSRARDRMVLVRSIDIKHVPNLEDVKIPILEFFSAYSGDNNDRYDDSIIEMPPNKVGRESVLASLRVQSEKLLQSLLVGYKYTVRPMEIMPSGMCVENGDARASISIVSVGETLSEWKTMLLKQEAIERVGWKCMRVDALTLLTNHCKVMQNIELFLSSAGVEPSLSQEILSHEVYDEVNENQEDPIVVEISSDDEEEEAEEVPISQLNTNNSCHSNVTSRVKCKEESDDMLDPRQFGDVIGDLDFLGVNESQAKAETTFDDSDDVEDKKVEVTRSWGGSDDDVKQKSNKRSRGVIGDDDRSTLSDQCEVCDDSTVANERPAKINRRSYRRLDKYSRDGRWYPLKQEEGEIEIEEKGRMPAGDWYDTDSDSVGEEKNQMED